MEQLKYILSILFLIATIAASAEEKVEKPAPDTVEVGIYMTSIHDIDFRQKEYSVNLWLWLKYRRSEFDFMKYLEVPMAKSFEKSYSTIDTLDDGRIYMLMKLQCVMKGTWRIKYFPFDRQKLRFAIENSNYDSDELVFSIDSTGKHYGNYFLMGWEKDSFNIKTDTRKYDTGFGDPTLDEPKSQYSTFRVTIDVHRDSWELFFKLFIGMYIAFLIAYVCLFIHADSIDSRLALSVGALFAVIGNKYIIDSALPESNSFTLVDTLHGFTLFFIFIIISVSVYSLKLTRENHLERANRLDKVTAAILMAIYIGLNYYFINEAFQSHALQ